MIARRTAPARKRRKWFTRPESGGNPILGRTLLEAAVDRKGTSV